MKAQRNFTSANPEFPLRHLMNATIAIRRHSARKKVFLFALATAVLACAISPLEAQIWNGGGANNNWSTTGNWDTAPVSPAPLTFAGSTRLANNNDLANFVANSITFDAAAGAFVIGGNDLTLSGNLGFNGNPSSPVTQTINLNTALSGNQSIDTPANGSLVLGGNITSVNDLTKTGAGTLTLGGVDTFAGGSINGGTNTITGNVTFNGTGGSRLYLGNANPAFNGTVILQPGSALNVIGNYADAMVLGRDGGSGTIIQNGGTFTFNMGNQNYLFVGASGNAATRSEYDMNGGVLDMSGKTLGIGLGAGAAITGIVSQVSGVITNVFNLQPGALTPNGLGIYTLKGGSIYIGSGGITTSSGLYNLNLGGGTIAASATWTSPLNMNLTNLNGSVTFDTAANNITLSGALTGNGGLIKIGSGTLEISGANNYTGNTVVNEGTLQLDVTGSTLGSVRVANGALLNLNFSGNYAAAGLFTNGVALPVGIYNSGNLPGFIIGSGNLQVSSSISTGLWTGNGTDNNWSTAGNWDQNAEPIFPISLTFAGSTRLVNNNDLSGITANSLTFGAAAGAFVLNGNDITLNGNIGFNGAPVAPVTQTVNLNMTWNNDKTINVPTNGSLVVGGNIADSLNTLTETGSGNVTLSGANSLAGLIVNGGTNTITGNTTITGTGGTFFFLGNADTNFNGTLVIQPGAALTINGSFGDNFVVGRDGGSGRVIQNGGTFTYSPANRTYFFIGATSHLGTRAEYDMNGGVLDLGSDTLVVGFADGTTTTGILNQAGGTINNVGTLAFYTSPLPNGSGYGNYTLSGGTITIGAGGIVSSSGTHDINLGGGTVAASASWISPLNMNLTNLNGSVTFDTAGNLIVLSGSLSGNGGLTVTGPGTLDLAGTNNYTGDTIVNAGSTLQLDVAGTSPSKLRLATGALLNLNFSGTYVAPGLFTNGVALPSGVYNAGNLPGFLSGTGNLQVSGVVFASQPQNQLVYLNGNYHQSVTLMSSTIGGPATYQWYLNGNPISGANSTNLTLSNLQITNAGNLYLVATSVSGSVTSSVAALTIYAVNNNVFAYDGFAYPDSVVVDGSSQNGGFGWNGPWQHTDGNGVQITLGNLLGGANVPAGFDSRSISNCIEVPSNAQTRSGRFFDCSATSELAKQGFIDNNGNIGANGKTVYLGFLEQPDRTSGFYELEFHRGNLSDPGRIGGIGNDTGSSDVNLRAPNGVNNRSLGAGTTGVNFYVVRIDYKAGNDDVFVYRNPTSNTESATPTLTASNVSDMSLNGVSVAAYNGPDLKVDEIRLGATFADALGLAVSNLLPPTKIANGYSVQFASTPGYTYRIQRATSLTGPWTDITTNTAPANGFVTYQDTSAPAGTAFYRTVTP